MSAGRVKKFHFFVTSKPALAFTQPPSPWITGALSPVVKRLRHEADHSPPTSAEVTIAWIHTSLIQLCIFLSDNLNFDAFLICYFSKITNDCVTQTNVVIKTL
jgi:hypothetical protein